VTSVYLSGAEGQLSLSVRPLLAPREAAAAHGLQGAAGVDLGSPTFGSLTVEILPAALVAGRVTAAWR